ncbi:MAG: Hint domain-containing protein [Roseovarius sp.]
MGAAQEARSGGGAVAGAQAGAQAGTQPAGAQPAGFAGGFALGTVIATPAGERPVETLRAGDRVLTRDNGLQRVRWVGRCRLGAADLHRAPRLRPVRIRSGALAARLPEHDIMVSAGHRILIRDDRAARFFEDSEVLVAACDLLSLAGVEIVDTESVGYVQFMFDQHQVVLANGMWSESFCPDGPALAALAPDARRQILALFPGLADARGRAGYRPARKPLSGAESRLLLSG